MTIRKSNINQKAVSNACENIVNKGGKVTVSEVINIIGGSYSTVGKMVKQWKQEKEKADRLAVVEMPEGINRAMKIAVAQLWETANKLLGEEVKRTKEEAKKHIGELQEELTESLTEISRLETKISTTEINLKNVEKSILKLQKINNKLSMENSIIKNQFKERDDEVIRLRKNNERLQNELIEIAKQKNKKI